jgi:hypothetical protein
MVKDYSASCVINKGRNKKKVRRKKVGPQAKEFFSATRLMWKALGAMLFVTVVIGISSSIWYGWQVQLALDQIGKDRSRNIELQEENRLLIAQHDLMLTQDHMEKSARKIGLYSPSKNQIRYP